jgi:phosphoserine phosphatase
MHKGQALIQRAKPGGTGDIGTTRHIRAVIFDMDGVLFEGRNFWLDLHRRYGTDVEGLRLADRYLTSDYATLAAKVAGQLWRGRPAKVYESLVQQRRYQPGVNELFGFLREHGVRTAIVSSGPDLLAARAQRDLAIDLVRANGLEIHDGRLTGRTFIRVSDTGKAKVGLEVMRELGVHADQTAMVGDSESDAELAALVGLAIAYDSDSDRLKTVAQHHLRRGELLQVREILRSSSVRRER